MKKSTLYTIQRMVKKSGGVYNPALISPSGTVQILADCYSDILVKELESLNKKAADSWSRYASDSNVKDSSGYYYGIMEELVKCLDMTLDYPGLYVAYELTRNGKTFTEYSPLGAIRQYNNFWNHW